MKVAILIDDYSRNLHDWCGVDIINGEPIKFVGVKFYNGINGNNKTWNGLSISNKTSSDIQRKQLDEIIKRYESEADEVRLFVDMDGVLAKWDVGASEEEVKAPGYFSSRELEHSIADALKDFNFEICSAAYNDNHSKAEKEWWLEHNAINHNSFLFVPYGSSKRNSVAQYLCNGAI